MVRRYLDLKPHFNFKMVFLENTAIPENEDIGIHNYIIRESNFPVGKIEKGEIAASFERNCEGEHLVICEGQRIRVDKICNQVHIFGFNSWGAFKDKFLLVTSNESLTYTVGFSDYGWDVKTIIPNQLEADRKDYAEYGDVFKTFKVFHGVHHKTKTAFLYYKTIVLKKDTYLKEIVLPDNPLMYIAAITLEVENEH